RYLAPEDYFLMVAEMVPYKRLNYAIRYFAQSGRRLKVVGTGPEYKSLKKLSGPSVEFCGRVTEVGLRDLYSRCRALVVPGEEDFGITMVEALASGKPVLAVARGGAVEIVRNGQGILYPESDEASLAEAVRSFDRIESQIDPHALVEYASGFSEPVFQKRFADAIGEMWSPKPRAKSRRIAAAGAGPVLVLPRHDVAAGE
ncbi:MAG TPA: glycosyltransferase, partial [Bryobacteraceae bacterium]|nr:glycosyltransferase [Bryobacteraceae bacterium]